MHPSASVTTSDRLGFTLFMAAVAHALVILGVGFTVQNKSVLPTTLAITLATYKSNDPPKQADYRAQFNQQSSGTLAEKALPTSDQLAPLPSSQINDVYLAAQPAASLKQQPDQTAIVTQAESQQRAPDRTQTPSPPTQTTESHRPEPLIDLKQEIASLEAQFRRQRQAYAKRPRIKRLTAASTLEEPGALYKESWRRKVENIGNINYPAQARRDKLYGELRLMVAINRDGSLHTVKILRSSGYQVLDDAAIRIVQLAAPFASFGDDLQHYDQVEIIRTWRFESGNQLSSH